MDRKLWLEFDKRFLRSRPAGFANRLAGRMRLSSLTDAIEGRLAAWLARTTWLARWAGGGAGAHVGFAGLADLDLSFLDLEDEFEGLSEEQAFEVLRRVAPRHPAVARLASVARRVAAARSLAVAPGAAPLAAVRPLAQGVSQVERLLAVTTGEDAGVQPAPVEALAEAAARGLEDGSAPAAQAAAGQGLEDLAAPAGRRGKRAAREARDSAGTRQQGAVGAAQAPAGAPVTAAVAPVEAGPGGALTVEEVSIPLAELEGFEGAVALRQALSEGSPAEGGIQAGVTARALLRALVAQARSAGAVPTVGVGRSAARPEFRGMAPEVFEALRLEGLEPASEAAAAAAGYTASRDRALAARGTDLDPETRQVLRMAPTLAALAGRRAPVAGGAGVGTAGIGIAGSGDAGGETTGSAAAGLPAMAGSARRGAARLAAGPAFTGRMIGGAATRVYASAPLLRSVLRASTEAAGWPLAGTGDLAARAGAVEQEELSVGRAAFVPPLHRVRGRQAGRDVFATETAGAERIPVAAGAALPGVAPERELLTAEAGPAENGQDQPQAASGKRARASRRVEAAVQAAGPRARAAGAAWRPFLGEVLARVLSSARRSSASLSGLLGEASAVPAVAARATQSVAPGAGAGFALEPGARGSARASGEVPLALQPRTAWGAGLTARAQTGEGAELGSPVSASLGTAHPLLTSVRLDEAGWPVVGWHGGAVGRPGMARALSESFTLLAPLAEEGMEATALAPAVESAAKVQATVLRSAERLREVAAQWRKATPAGAPGVSAVQPGLQVQESLVARQPQALRRLAALAAGLEVSNGQLVTRGGGFETFMAEAARVLGTRAPTVDDLSGAVAQAIVAVGARQGATARAGAGTSRSFTVKGIGLGSLAFGSGLAAGRGAVALADQQAERWQGYISGTLAETAADPGSWAPAGHVVRGQRPGAAGTEPAYGAPAFEADAELVRMESEVPEGGAVGATPLVADRGERTRSAGAMPAVGLTPGAVRAGLQEALRAAIAAPEYLPAGLAERARSMVASLARDRAVASSEVRAVGQLLAEAGVHLAPAVSRAIAAWRGRVPSPAEARAMPGMAAASWAGLPALHALFGRSARSAAPVRIGSAVAGGSGAARPVPGGALGLDASLGALDLKVGRVAEGYQDLSPALREWVALQDEAGGAAAYGAAEAGTWSGAARPAAARVRGLAPRPAGTGAQRISVSAPLLRTLGRDADGRPTVQGLGAVAGSGETAVTRAASRADVWAARGQRLAHPAAMGGSAAELLRLAQPEAARAEGVAGVASVRGMGEPGGSGRTAREAVAGYRTPEVGEVVAPALEAAGVVGAGAQVAAAPAGRLAGLRARVAGWVRAVYSTPGMAGAIARGLKAEQLAVLLASGASPASAGAAGYQGLVADSAVGAPGSLLDLPGAAAAMEEGASVVPLRAARRMPGGGRAVGQGAVGGTGRSGMAGEAVRATGTAGVGFGGQGSGAYADVGGLVNPAQGAGAASSTGAAGAPFGPGALGGGSAASAGGGDALSLTLVSPVVRMVSQAASFKTEAAASAPTQRAPVQQQSPSQAPASGAKGGDAQEQQKKEMQALLRDVVESLRRRMKVERERRGFFD